MQKRSNHDLLRKSKVPQQSLKSESDPLKSPLTDGAGGRGDRDGGWGGGGSGGGDREDIKGANGGSSGGRCGGAEGAAEDR